MFKRNILVIASACFCMVACEPPTSQYGTPLGAPLTSYGTPNYNNGGLGGIGGHGGGHGGGNGGGHGGDHGDYGEPKAYEFGYQVKDDYTGNNYDRKEQSDGNQVRGEYRVALPDGRTQIVTYYADWQSGFHADVRYEGEAQYPEQYNNGGGYNGPSGQYGAPGGDYSGGYNSGGYNHGGSSSVQIKDYSSGGTPYNAGGYSSGGNGGYSGAGGYSGYDSYNSGNFGGKGRPTAVYGAP